MPFADCVYFSYFAQAGFRTNLLTLDRTVEFFVPNVYGLLLAKGGKPLNSIEKQPFKEKHFPVSELAKLWNISPDVVRRLFSNEPGVVVIYRPHPDKRPYRSLRIPERVAIRVYEKMSLSELVIK